MSIKKEPEKREFLIQYAPVAGIVLVVSGLLFLLDQRIQTNWLSLSIPLFISIVLILAGYITRRKLWLVSGWILFGLGGVLFFLAQRFFDQSIGMRLCLAFAITALAWLLMFLSCHLLWKKTHWWAFFVASISAALALSFSMTNPGLLDFVLFSSISLSVVFIAWGLSNRKIGLIIPGLLISTIGSGIYSAWAHPKTTPEGLKETGTMLVWFALGWILITVLSRIMDKRFIWWPLIPGGILLMVGSGLYIGGNPENTLGFLGNTGSIALILLGIYLILLKFGIKNE